MSQDFTHTLGLPENAIDVVGIGLVSAVVTVALGAVPLFDLVPLHVIAGIAVPVGILFCGRGAVAVGVGYLVGQLVVGLGVFESVLLGVTYVVIGYVAGSTWRRLSRVEIEPGRQRPVRYLRRAVLAAAVAALSGAAVLAWGYEVLGIGPFFLASTFALAFALIGAVVALPVLAAYRYLSDRGTIAGDIAETTPRTVPVDRPDGCLRGSVAVLVVWVAVGTIGSIGYRWFDLLLAWNPNSFALHDIEALTLLYNDALFGVGGRHIQVVFGGMMLAIHLLWLADSDALSPVTMRLSNGGND